MAVKQLRQIGDPILHKVCKEIELEDPNVQRIAQDLHDTYMHLAINRWASGFMTGGIAANQLGHDARMVILRIGQIYPCQRTVIVNPQLRRVGEMTFDFWSGCGSVPDKWALVETPFEVVLEGYKMDGTPCSFTYFGRSVGPVYHEMNHIDGKTILDLAKEVFPSYQAYERFYKS